MRFPVGMDSSASRPPVLPGLTLHRRLGRGGHGEVWLADDDLTGEPVAVKLGAQMRLLEPELALLCRIDHPHVLRLVRVVPAPGGSAMVLQLAEGGSLAGLVDRHGPLTPGEVSTVLVPLAAAVEHLHRRGVAHGDITAANVLFGADGKPVLGDLGAAHLIGTAVDKPWRTPGFVDPAIATGADPRAVDVWGLGAVGWFALTGRPPSEGSGVRDVHRSGPGAAALVRLLAECLATDPATRPEPTEIARLAWEAAPPVPIRLTPPEPAGPAHPAPVGAASFDAASFSQQVTTPPAEPPADPPAGRSGETGAVAGPGRKVRSGTSRWVLAGALVAATLLAVGMAALVLPGRSPSAQAPRVQPAETAPAPPPDLTQVLHQLGAARAAAFRSLSPEQLAWADEPGSPAAVADARLVQRLKKAGRRLDGVHFRIAQVRLAPSGRSSSHGTGSGDTVTVTARVSTSAYRQVEVDGDGSVAMPAQPARRVTLTLATVDGSWRVRSIEAVE